jgi:hypothetical protein
MMRVQKKRAAAVAVAFILSACIIQPDYADIARQHGLNETERANLEICDQAFWRIYPVLRYGKELRQMTHVPEAVCACHSKDMAQVFKTGKLKSYANFANWWKDPYAPKLPSFTSNAVKGNPATAPRTMIASFDRCAKDFIEANKNNEEFEDLLREPVLKNKPPAKPEKAKEEPAAAEQAAGVEPAAEQ